MTNRVTFTQAELRRATKVAKEFGCEVVIFDGAIRIVAPCGDIPLVNEGCDDQAEIDRAFGCGT